MVTEHIFVVYAGNSWRKHGYCKLTVLSEPLTFFANLYVLSVWQFSKICAFTDFHENQFGIFKTDGKVLETMYDKLCSQLGAEVDFSSNAIYQPTKRISIWNNCSDSICLKDSWILTKAAWLKISFANMLTLYIYISSKALIQQIPSNNGINCCKYNSI